MSEEFRIGNAIGKPSWGRLLEAPLQRCTFLNLGRYASHVCFNSSQKIARNLDHAPQTGAGGPQPAPRRSARTIWRHSVINSSLNAVFEARPSAGHLRDFCFMKRQTVPRFGAQRIPARAAS
jgi:hypothetical protein